MKKNFVREKLRSGETSIGCFIGLGSPTVAEMMGLAGYDWLMIETEHNAVDWADVQQMLMAASGTDAVPMVRLPSSDSTHIQRALYIGARGIMVPLVRSVEEVQRVVSMHPLSTAGTAQLWGAEG